MFPRKACRGTLCLCLLDNMQAKGPVVDMVEMFSAELPLFTLSEILGIPEADLVTECGASFKQGTEFVAWSDENESLCSMS